MEEEKDTGGPAFPLGIPEDEGCYRHHEDGMTWVDSAAIQLASNYRYGDPQTKEEMASWSFDVAEALLAEKRKREETNELGNP